MAKPHWLMTATVRLRSFATGKVTTHQVAYRSHKRPLPYVWCDGRTYGFSRTRKLAESAMRRTNYGARNAGDVREARVQLVPNPLPDGWRINDTYHIVDLRGARPDSFAAQCLARYRNCYNGN